MEGIYVQYGGIQQDDDVQEASGSREATGSPNLHPFVL